MGAGQVLKIHSNGWKGTIAMLRAACVLCPLLLILGVGCDRDASSPADTFRLIQAAARSQAKTLKKLSDKTPAQPGDLACFRQYTSRTTIDFLRKQGVRDETAINGWLTFMLQRLCTGAPHEIVGVELNGNVGYLKLSAREISNDQRALTKLTFVNEEGPWKIDLRDGIQSWLDLDDLGHQSMENMYRAILQFQGLPDLLLPREISSDKTLKQNGNTSDA